VRDVSPLYQRRLQPPRAFLRGREQIQVAEGTRLREGVSALVTS